MPQIIESNFRVLDSSGDDFLLTDIGGAGLPVYVEKEQDNYTSGIESSIRNLKTGNVIEGEIQSESVTRQDDYWKFVRLTITDHTRFHFIENADNHSSHVQRLLEAAEERGEEAVRTTISSEGAPIGYISVSEDRGDEFWSGLRSGLNSHENDIQNLDTIGSPPYEVIYTRTSDEEKLVFYHFKDMNTEPARAIISNNWL